MRRAELGDVRPGAAVMIEGMHRLGRVRVERHWERGWTVVRQADGSLHEVDSSSVVAVLKR